MTARYHFSYSTESTYGHVVEMLRLLKVPPGLVLDLGCGYGVIAEPLSELGYEYVGCDLDADGLKDLDGRGFEVHELDLADTSTLACRLVDMVEERDVRAILLLDVLEHMPDPAEFLTAMRSAADTFGRPLLFASIPNVGHYDVGAKLAFGRWDITPTGLLDSTHLQMFTESRLVRTLGGAGWCEIARRDLSLPESDQHFPTEHPALARHTPLRQLLSGLRSRVDGHAEINQFVRAFALTDAAPDAVEEEEPALFATVIMRTQGLRMSNLEEALTCLAAQTDDDFEVVLVVHSPSPAYLEAVRALVGSFAAPFSSRVHVHRVVEGTRATPLNLGLAQARGRYVAFLDDDDLVMAHWIESFRRGADRAAGRVVRSNCALRRIQAGPGEPLGAYEAVSGLESPFADRFDLIEHVYHNSTPICSFAAPMAAVRLLNVSFDEGLNVLEDWQFFLQVAVVCGVEDTSTVTSLYQFWESRTGSRHEVEPEVWDVTRSAVLQRLDREPLLLPKGSTERLGRMWAETQELEDLRTRLAEAESQFRIMLASRSWRWFRPLRWMAARARRVSPRRRSRLCR